MIRHVVPALLAALGGACASGESSSDAGFLRIDAAPLPDSGTRQPDAGDDPDPDADTGTPAAPVINEFVAQHSGADTCELVEVAGAASTSYAGYAVIVIEGDTTPNPGVVQKVFDVGTTDADGLWVTAALSQDSLQNGSTTLLLVRDYAGGLVDLDADNDGALDSEPWTELADAVAVDDGSVGDLLYGVPALTEDFDGGAISVGGASRVPDAADTDAAGDWVRNSFNGDGLPGECDDAAAASGEALNTPGAPNTVQL